ncbi:uncharacterized protein LOC107030017 [Solanum pennellii]|uniref:Uncharacterized protein LOC107030017 n=1 Tax=Solanum pennellii TaxID=28526 RepID=A0ABM1HKU2_SOLPN|nr:uncharacterized protein LOC107030017 [Solanum pennellii]
MILSEFNIVYLSKKVITAQDIADHLGENIVDEEYETLKTYFPNEEVLLVDEDISETYLGLIVLFDGEKNHLGKCIEAFLVSESGYHYLMVDKLRFDCTNTMVESEACILGLKMAIDMNVQELLVIRYSDMLIHHVQDTPKRQNEFRLKPKRNNEFADTLATIASMIKHPDTDYIDPMDIQVKKKPVHCSHVEPKRDGLP